MDKHLEVAISEALKLLGEDRLFPVLIKEVSPRFVVSSNKEKEVKHVNGK